MSEQESWQPGDALPGIHPAGHQRHAAMLSLKEDHNFEECNFCLAFPPAKFDTPARWPDPFDAQELSSRST